ncbi:cytochrome P450 [Amycolatopsis sp. cmx-4-68]|uniref:cytochrome P450 n=1 Tax=Amycolatopsis sp. cmx-4-68 TaxID=2790938 RepID=UPI00397E794C
MTDTGSSTSVPLAEAPSFPEPRTCPYAPPDTMVRLAERGPLNKVRLYNGREAWLVSGYFQARSLLSDPRISADRTNPDFPILAPRFEAGHARKVALLGADPPEHDTHRKLLNPEFTIKQIQAMRPRVEQITGELIDRMVAAGPPVDLVSALAVQVPSITVSEMIGVPVSEAEFFQSVAGNLMQSIDAETLQTSARQLFEYLTRMAVEQEREPGPGLIGVLARGVRAGELTREELVQILYVLLVAGHETTSGLISLGVMTLLEHPAQLDEIKKDPALVPTAVEELLRFVALTETGGLRVATEDVEIDGYLIKAGDGVLMSASLVNRDPQVHDRPHEFDIHRTSRRHLAFGHGIHQCIGQNLARLELEVVFGMLFSRLPGLRMTGPVDQVPLRSVEFGPVQSVLELPVVW